MFPRLILRSGMFTRPSTSSGRRLPRALSCLALVVFCFFGLAQTTAARHVWYVRADAAPGGDGRSWPTAFDNPRPALLNPDIGPGDQVWVARGEYRPDGGSGQPFLHFPLVDGIKIFGGFVGNELSLDQRNWEANPTILTGDLAGNDTDDFETSRENSHHVLVATETVTGVLIDGLIIRGGSAWWPIDDNAVGGGLRVTGGTLILRNCTFEHNRAIKDGGGVYARDAEITIENCRFIDNLAILGGGVAVVYDSVATVIGSTFAENITSENGGGGAALWADIHAGPLMIDRCVFERNALPPSVLYEGHTVLITRNLGFPPQPAIITNSIFRENGVRDQADARGTLLSSTDTTISDCLFIGNMAASGGAVELRGTDPGIIERCHFEGNHGGFGTVRISDGAKTVVDSTFVGNMASNGSGGAIYSDSEGSVIARCVFDSNQAERGGALYLADWSGPLVDDCTFVNNVATDWGGAIASLSTGPVFRDSLFSGNRAGREGGAIAANQSHTIVNCTFSANVAEPPLGIGGGTLHYQNSVPNIENCIYWGNSDSTGRTESAQIQLATLTYSIDHTCIEGLSGSFGGVGNIARDPLFADFDGIDGIVGTEDDDLTLLPGSPCIDAGNSDAVSIDNLTDLRGGERRVDDPNTPDSGSGVPPLVDMGAFEFLSDGAAMHLAAVEPGRSGVLNSFRVIGASPGGIVAFTYATSAGTASVPGCPQLLIDLNRPSLFGQATADALGRVRLDRLVPGAAQGRLVLFQCVDSTACRKSNVTKTLFQ